MGRLFKGRKADGEPSAPWATALNLVKLLSVLLCVSIIGNVAQAIALTALFPLKEKVPVIVAFREPSQNFVVIEKAEGKIRSNPRLLSMFLRRYIVDRETVDKQTETEIRYPRVMAMSDGLVKQDFKTTHGPPNGLFYRDGFKRYVRIIRDSPLAAGIHQVEFETRDTIDSKPGELQGAEPVKTEWVATITYDYRDQAVKADEAATDFNPMGLFIIKYSIAKRQ